MDKLTKALESSPTENIKFATCAGALYDICNQDALCIVEQDIFDKIYSLIRYFLQIFLDRYS